jgi:LysM repeat protein
MSMGALARANGIANPNLIQTGRFLRIPGAARPLYYHVHWGDTLLGIAGRYRLRVSDIRALNPRLGPYLLAGSWLRLCTGCGGNQSVVSSSPQPGNTAPSGLRYVVQRGDTLSSIAVRYSVSVATLEAANHIRNPALIMAGSILTVPGASAAGSGYRAGTAADPYNPSLAHSLIAGWARYYGISPSLALAVAWQESGFNQSMTSETGAIGVMQVEPYTARRIAQLLGRSLNLYNVDDNVHGGVFWLAHLLNFYGWNVQLAVEAYYQGTRSLAARGPFTDTLQYVRNVLSLQGQFGG